MDEGPLLEALADVIDSAEVSVDDLCTRIGALTDARRAIEGGLSVLDVAGNLLVVDAQTAGMIDARSKHEAATLRLRACVIGELVRGGMTFTAIARRAGLSRQRIAYLYHSGQVMMAQDKVRRP